MQYTIHITHRALRFTLHAVCLALFLLMFIDPISVMAENSPSKVDVKAIVQRIDELYRSQTSHADMEMQIVTPHWERTLALEVWTKGMDRTFILISSPKKEKGVATLRIRNEMWNYLPKTNKVMKVPPSMMMGSWMGSDFTNDDLVRESSMLEDYTYQVITPEDAEPEHLYLQLLPKEDSPIVWGKLIVAVQESDLIPVWQHFYDESGRLMRVMNFKDVKPFDGKTVPSVMEIIPQNKDGHRTVVRFVDAEFDKPLDDKIFTRRNLRKKRRAGVQASKWANHVSRITFHVIMTLKIAFRNIFRQKRRTILTALAMIVGFTLSSVFIGWSDGAYSDIIAMFTRNRIGHIQVHQQDYLDKPSLYKTIGNYESVGQTIGSVSGVEAWTPRVYSAGLGSVGDKSTAVQIIGVDAGREARATRFDKKVIDGQGFSEAQAPEAILGKGLARILSATVGDEIVIVSQGADGSIANDLYTIVGIAESGDETTDRMACYLHIKDAQELLVLEARAHEIVVVVSNINHVGKIARAIESHLDDSALDVAPWQEVAKSFYRAMQADKQGDLIGPIVIMLIVAIGVLNTVLMSVLERTREYGVLKAVGTKPVQIFWLVICEVVIIALGSIVIGALLGILINYLLSIYGITLPQEFTYGGIKFQTMYAEVSARSLIIPAITVLVSAAIVSLFPALKAARILPAKAMRTH